LTLIDYNYGANRLIRLDPGSTQAPIPKFIDARPVVEDHRLPRSREKREDERDKKKDKEEEDLSRPV